MTDAFVCWWGAQCFCKLGVVDINIGGRQSSQYYTNLFTRTATAKAAGNEFVKFALCLRGFYRLFRVVVGGIAGREAHCAPYIVGRNTCRACHCFYSCVEIGRRGDGRRYGAVEQRVYRYIKIIAYAGESYIRRRTTVAHFCYGCVVNIQSLQHVSYCNTLFYTLFLYLFCNSRRFIFINIRQHQTP